MPSSPNSPFQDQPSAQKLITSNKRRLLSTWLDSRFARRPLPTPVCVDKVGKGRRTVPYVNSHEMGTIMVLKHLNLAATPCK